MKTFIVTPLVAGCTLLLWGAPVRGREHEEGSAEDSEDEHEHEHEQGPLALGLDVVFGFGGVEGPLPPGGAAEPLAIAVDCQSFLLGAGYEVAERIGVGLRFPMTFASVPEAGTTTHSVFAVGNLELEGEAEIELSETLALELSLGVALPTAQGSEELELEDRTDYDQFVVNAIAASARGFEDNALFEIDRVGIVPHVALHAHAGRFLVDPFVKLENLIATNSEAERGYIAELVVGTFAGAELSEHLDLGARLWLAAAFLDEVETVAVAEPQLRLHYEPVEFVLGGILPFAGELTDPYFGGIRLGVAARL